MKLVCGSTEDTLRRAQEYVDSFPQGSTVAVAYNEDTAKLSYQGKRVISVTECGELISKAFSYEEGPSEYHGEPIDLAVLGLGYEAQIGFNEIGTAFSSTVHEQKLTDATKREMAFLGEVPDTGKTLGIKDLVSASSIMVLALGEDRADALFHMMYGRTDSAVPAAFLQVPADVTVFADEAAAAKI